MPNILLIGGSGLLGSEFKDILESENISFDSPSSKEFDITNTDSIKSYLFGKSYDFVINCSGYNKVDEAERSEAEKDRCFELNSFGPERLAKFLAKNMPFSVLIQFSSDYVFDGESLAGYDEFSPKSPICVYAKSKALGEDLVLSGFERSVVIRTSWLFGRYGDNFASKIVRGAAEGRQLLVVDDQFGKPTYAQDIAKSVLDNLEFFAENSGVFHLANESEMSWYEFARLCVEFSGLDVNLVTGVKSSEYKVEAKRPMNSVLVNTKLPKLRSGVEAIKEYISGLN
jgi:dTDP-4-dehydrorhamnose reductase